MSELDSFFAKKDKKKTKKGKKFTTTDEIAKRLETTEKKSEKSIIAAANTHARKEELRKEELAHQNQQSETTEGEAPVEEPKSFSTVTLDQKPEKKAEEEIWNDFKDDTAVDVSNLKIAKLNIEEEEEGRNEKGDDSKSGNNGDKKDGVWQTEEAPDIQQTICDAVDAEADEGLDKVKATVAAMSNARWTSGQKDMQPSPLPRGSSSGATRVRSKLAPDISNSVSFPSLADAGRNNRKMKTEEHHSSNSRTVSQNHPNSMLRSRGSDSSGAYKPPMLRTANRFGALTDHSGRHS